MPTTEWHIPFELETTQGTFPINQGFPGFFLDQTKCRARRRIRATTNDIPQGDGEIFHARFAGGYEMTLNGQAWASQNELMCAGTDELVDLRDELYGHLWALLHPPNDGGRVIWTPTGKSNRMLDGVLLLDIADPEISDIGVVTFEFTVDTRFPYAITEAQTVTTISGAGSIVNNGNVEFWPVIQVQGPAGIFRIENLTTGLELRWDSFYGGTAIGAGEYAEIDTFKGTIFLNGDGADLSASLEATSSDFFPLVPGTNNIFTTFTSADFLHNDAFA